MTTGKRYQVVTIDLKANGTVAAIYESARIDHARKRFDEEPDLKAYHRELRDTVAGEVLEAKGIGLAEEKKEEKKEKKEKKPRKPRRTSNGDAVGQHLQTLESIDDIAVLAENMLLDVLSAGGLMSPGKGEKDKATIHRALARAKGTGDYEGKPNPGSGRMSLGLMIRKYCRLLNRPPIGAASA